MATKKMTPGSFEHKLAIMKKIYDDGARDEKALAEMDVNKMLSIEGISIDDLRMMLEIQKQVKANKLFSYLAEQPKEEGGDAQ